MREPLLVCVDPDAIDTHKGRTLDIDSWLDDVMTMAALGDGPGGRMIAPGVLAVHDLCPSDEACLGGVAA